MTAGRHRTVVLSAGGSHLERVLVACGLAGVVPDAVLLVSAPPRPLDRRVRRALQRPPRHSLAAVGRRVARLAAEDDAVAGFAREHRYAGPLNTPAMVAALRDAAPDYLFLAGVGIVGADVLAVPAKATVNAHPGLLPWAPGVGVVERSLERGVPVGVTAHLVDEGIDTGALVRRELIPVSPSDTLGSLRRKAEERSARLLAELIGEVGAGRTLTAERQRGAGAYCTWPSAAERRGIADAVRGGLALRLHEEWRERYGEALPLDASAQP